MNEEIQSYEEWNNRNRWIHRGEKPVYIKDGHNYFSKSQTYFSGGDQWKLVGYLGASGPWDDMPH